MTTVRPLSMEDHAQWGVLFRNYVEFYKADLTDAIYANVWSRLMSHDVGSHSGLCAADVTGKLIGIAHYVFRESTWSTGKFCYLEDLFVSPNVRAKGVGHALIKAVYDQADKCDAARVYWVTQEDNYRARGLYDKLATKSPFIQYRR